MTDEQTIPASVENSILCTADEQAAEQTIVMRLISPGLSFYGIKVTAQLGTGEGSLLADQSDADRVSVSCETNEGGFKVISNFPVDDSGPVRWDLATSRKTTVPPDGVIVVTISKLVCRTQPGETPVRIDFSNDEGVSVAAFKAVVKKTGAPFEIYTTSLDVDVAWGRLDDVHLSWAVGFAGDCWATVVVGETAEGVTAGQAPEAFRPTKLQRKGTISLAELFRGDALTYKTYSIRFCLHSPAPQNGRTKIVSRAMFVTLTKNDSWFLAQPPGTPLALHSLRDRNIGLFLELVSTFAPRLVFFHLQFLARDSGSSATTRFARLLQH